jgi:nucleoside-diphosphate-sugar epimerase
MAIGLDIKTEIELETLLSEPTEEVVAAFRELPGDIILLGVAGKMGPTLARMAQRASTLAGTPRRVIGVSRFSAGGEEALQAAGVETIRCDLLDEEDVARLPQAPNILYLAGRKFGSTGDEPATWAMNAYIPGVVCRRFRNSRISALSSGNIYGLVPVAGGGSREEDSPQPLGEYAMSCLARERLFEFFSRALEIPMTLIRLNYACELRYGVLVDLAERIRQGQPVDLRMGYLNTIWQGDANAMILCALGQAVVPPLVLNLTGQELLSVRSVCERMSQIMNKPVRFEGNEMATALLSDSRRARALFGPPRVPASRLIEWVAGWVMKGGRSLGKPTHFESRDGRF